MLCASCGMDLHGGELCSHHHCLYGDDWAARLTEIDRADDSWGYADPGTY